MIDKRTRQILLGGHIKQAIAGETVGAIGLFLAKYGPKMLRWGKHAAKLGWKGIKGVKNWATASKLGATAAKLGTTASRTAGLAGRAKLFSGAGNAARVASVAQKVRLANKARRAYGVARVMRPASLALMAMPAATRGLNRLSGYNPEEQQNQRVLTDFRKELMQLGPENPLYQQYMSMGN